MSGPALSQHFERYFEAVLAKDEATRREIFRLRYAVYCQELGYEDATAFPDGEERDAFDEQSSFVLVRHRASGRAAGCLRLIQWQEGDTEWRFPFEQTCAGHLDSDIEPELVRSRARIGEVSRLAVHSDFRRRRGEAHDPAGGDVEGAVRVFGDRQYPLIALGLFLSACALGLNAGLDEVWVMMEPRLARLLASCGLPFTRVGDVIEYHGQRGPFRILRGDVIPNLRPDVREWLETLQRTLRE